MVTDKLHMKTFILERHIFFKMLLLTFNGYIYIFIYIVSPTWFTLSFTLLYCLEVVFVSTTSTVDKTLALFSPPIVPPSWEISGTIRAAFSFLWKEAYKVRVSCKIYVRCSFKSNDRHAISFVSSLM